ncbi:MAG: hypothetical protein ACI9YH_004203 [Colwellia sp.]|jgi:hypothetical protein
MSNLENLLLTNITAKHVQFCNGLKGLIDGGCSLDSLSNVIEELCDQSENIDQLSNRG